MRLAICPVVGCDGFNLDYGPHLVVGKYAAGAGYAGADYADDGAGDSNGLDCCEAPHC